MRLAFWAIAIFAAAVALTLASRLDPGYALLVMPPYRVEISLTLLMLIVLGGFVAFYILLRTVSGMLALPAAVRAFRARRRAEKARNAMRDGLRALLEGSYGQAEKLALQAADAGESPELNALLAARAAHELGDYERRDGHLARAARDATEDALAATITRAELLVAERRFDDALAAVEELPPKARRHSAALRLELRARQQLGQWDEVPALATQLEKRGVLTPEHALHLRLRAHGERLLRAPAEGKALMEIWRSLPGAEGKAPRVAGTAARRLMEAKDCESARQVLESALKSGWDEGLVELYGRCEGGDVVRRIEWAERLLVEHPQDAGLLLTLGRLCARQQLWGKAQSYLEASLAVAPGAATHLELAKLLEKLEKPQEAVRHYRLSAQQAAR